MACYDFSGVTLQTAIYAEDAYCDKDRVWLCLNPSKCNTIRPSLDLKGEVWYVTRYSVETYIAPTYIDPDVVPDCKEDKLVLDGEWTGFDWKDSKIGF